MFEPRLYFVTPVYKRFALTRACLRQRRELLDALPFDARQVIVGDDANMEVAEEYGFECVQYPNDRGVGAKFNKGYRHAIRTGEATHVMAIGSDSWLHPDALSDAPWTKRGCLGLIGLSSVSPFGDERIDLQIKYPAGFGVGMVYPSYAIEEGGGASAHLNSGIDTSTWQRCGRGRVQIEFLRNVPQGYVNFHSPQESITDYYAVRGTHRRHLTTNEPWRHLVDAYGEENVRAVQGVYAAHALGVFFTGTRPVRRRVKDKRPLPGYKGRLPTAAARARQKEAQQPPNHRYTNMISRFEGLTGR